MAISDKTRKILWGRSGNRCAVCRRELVVDATLADDESVVGEECHIVSSSGQGPRFDDGFPPEQLDRPANLILLCRVHHKMVDDQFETYSVELLESIKTNHESWVTASLAETEAANRPLRIRQVNANVPTHLVRLTSGRALLSVLDGAVAYDFHHEEPESQQEMELIAGFLQRAQDYGDISDEYDAGDMVRATFQMNELILELEQAGFWIFGAVDVQQLEGGILTEPTDWPVAILNLVRPTNPEILKVPSPEVASDPPAADGDSQLAGLSSDA